MRVLLVEDDRMIGQAVQTALRQDGYAVDWVRNAESADTALATAGFDLVLLDLELPDMNGYQICSALKRDPGTADIPVIFLSSHSDIADITRGLELGAVDYVPKPVAPPILLARGKLKPGRCLCPSPWRPAR